MYRDYSLTLFYELNDWRTIEKLAELGYHKNVDLSTLSNDGHYNGLPYLLSLLIDMVYKKNFKSNSNSFW